MRGVKVATCPPTAQVTPVRLCNEARFSIKPSPSTEPAPLQNPLRLVEHRLLYQGVHRPRLFTMGLVVLFLRCYLVFQNVFITFKTLKLPPPSSRNNGQPSVRALTQRKRDMKGCMAIWIVWVSRVTFRALDQVTKLFTQVLPSAL
jgi:hypothetical protein